MRQFINQNYFRSLQKNRINIHFFKLLALVKNLFSFNSSEVLPQRVQFLFFREFRCNPIITSTLLFHKFFCFKQHSIGFTNTGSHPYIDFQFPFLRNE